jgi:hypothetical protein
MKRLFGILLMLFCASAIPAYAKKCGEVVFLTGSGSLYSGLIPEEIKPDRIFTEWGYKLTDDGMKSPFKTYVDISNPANICVVAFSLGAMVAHPDFEIPIERFYRVVVVDPYITSLQILRLAVSGWKNTTEPHGVVSIMRRRLSRAYSLCSSGWRENQNHIGWPHKAITSDMEVIRAIKDYLYTGKKRLGPIGDFSSC